MRNPYLVDNDSEGVEVLIQGDDDPEVNDTVITQ